MLISVPSLVGLVVFVTTVWAWYDSRSIEKTRGRAVGNFGPWGWFFLFALIWILAFPLYLVQRREALEQPPAGDAERATLTAVREQRRSFVTFLVGAAMAIVGGLVVFTQTVALMASPWVAAAGALSLGIGAIAMWARSPGRKVPGWAVAAVVASAIAVGIAGSVLRDDLERRAEKDRAAEVARQEERQRLERERHAKEAADRAEADSLHQLEQERMESEAAALSAEHEREAEAARIAAETAERERSEEERRRAEIENARLQREAEAAARQRAEQIHKQTLAWYPGYRGAIARFQAAADATSTAYRDPDRTKLQAACAELADAAKAAARDSALSAPDPVVAQALEATVAAYAGLAGACRKGDWDRFYTASAASAKGLQSLNRALERHGLKP